MQTHLARPEQSARGGDEPRLITPREVESDYRIPENTQAIWRCANRYGFRDLVIKVGRSVRYRRSGIEAWLESRRAAVQESASTEAI